MATYTVRLSEWVKSLKTEIEEEHPDIKLSYSQVMDYAAQKILDFPYRCYGIEPEEDEKFRRELNITILRKYFMREIGYETPELWKIQLESRLRLVMPKYRELYKSTLFELDFESPYHIITKHNEIKRDDGTVDRTGTRDTDTDSNTSTTYGKKTIDDGNGSRNSTTNTIGYDSDFPQFSFSQGDYATTGNTSDSTTNETTTTKNTESQSGTDTATGKGIEKETWKDGEKNLNTMVDDYIHDVSGHTTNMDILNAVEKWRELIVNINEMIVNDIADLFMMVYN